MRRPCPNTRGCDLPAAPHESEIGPAGLRQQRFIQREQFILHRDGAIGGLIAAPSQRQTPLRYAQRVAQSLRDASEALDTLRGRHQGKVKTALVTTTRYVVPRLIAQFHAQHPHIEPEVSIANSEAVITQLEAGEIDLAIMGRRPASHWWPSPLHAIPTTLSLRPTTPGRPKSSWTHKSSPTNLLSTEKPALAPARRRSFFAEHQIKPPMQCEMSSNESIKQAVMAGMGLAFISLHTIGLEQQTGHLVLLDIKGLPIVRTWYVLYPATKLLTPLPRRFRNSW